MMEFWNLLNSPYAERKVKRTKHPDDVPMKLKTATLLLAIPLFLIGAAQTQDTEPKLVQSHLIETEIGGLVLVQELEVEASISDVWNAYVTEDGWKAWSAPHVEIDLRPGGTIRSHYGPDAEVGDPGTITLNIVNYVPERLITLRAEFADHFPQFMKEDDENLMEVTTFEALGEKRTRITAYGVGYRDTPEYRGLIDFFIPANEGVYLKLKEYLEK